MSGRMAGGDERDVVVVGGGHNGLACAAYLGRAGLDVRPRRRQHPRFSKKDAGAYVEFDRYFDRVAGLLKDLLFVVPPNVRLRDVPAWLGMAARMRGWTGRDLHEAIRLFTMSAADFLDEWFEDERVKGAMDTQAIIGELIARVRSRGR